MSTVRRYATAVGARMLDGADVARGHYDTALPPRRLRHLAGGGDYVALADHLAALARDLGGMSSTARVLDVGAGTGRVALGLTRCLESSGTYDGLEVVRPAVTWCRRAFRDDHPNFRFHHADLRNRMYNPRGRIEPDEFTFPFAAESFDFAILTSVFTHLFRSTIDHYLAELHRVLVPGGRAMLTYFLLNDDARGYLERGQSIIKLAHPGDDTGALVADPALPEIAVGHPEEAMLELLAHDGLELVGAVHYGTWCGRATGATFQDVVIAQRTG